MADPKNYLFDLPTDQRPSHATINEEWYPGIKDYWEISTSRRIFDPIHGIRAIVIHATAGVTSSGAISVMRAGKASWHWLVPDEDEEAHGKLVWACAPEARAGWHVRNDKSDPRVNGGANRVNHWTLGIEIVNSQDKTTVDDFSDWQVEATARIVRYCWAKYPNLSQVVSHAMLDPQRRTDPGSHFPWEKFRGLVLNPISMDPVSPVVAATTPIGMLPEVKVPIHECCAPG